MAVEPFENRHSQLRLDVDHTHLSSRGTVSRPTMMLLADTAVYAAILSTMWAVVLSVTTNLNINFLRKLELPPKPFWRIEADESRETLNRGKGYYLFRT